MTEKINMNKDKTNNNAPEINTLRKFSTSSPNTSSNNISSI